MKLRARSSRRHRAADCTFHPTLTRDAVIGYFRRHGVVHKIARTSASGQRRRSFQGTITVENLRPIAVA